LLISTLRKRKMEKVIKLAFMQDHLPMTKSARASGAVGGEGGEACLAAAGQGRKAAERRRTETGRR